MCSIATSSLGQATFGGILSHDDEADKRRSVKMIHDRTPIAGRNAQRNNKRLTLLEFGKAIDDAKSHFITNLHLHHLGRETGAHTLGVFQFELDLASAALDQMKQQQCGQPVQLLIRRMLTHVKDLRHGISLSFGL
jgi:hypothetical protein